MAANYHKWKWLFRFVGPLLFIFFLLKVVDPWEAIKFLKEIRADMVLVSVIFFPAIMYVRTFRWWLICRQLNLEIPIHKLFQVGYISWFFGVLPFGGIYALSKVIYLRDEDIPAGKAFISIALDKLFDIVGLVLFGFYAIWYFPKGLVDEKVIWIPFGCLLLALCAGYLLKWKLWRKTKGMLKQFLNKQIQQVGKRLENDLKIFWAKFGLGIFVLMAALSICIYLLMSLVLYVLAHALDMPLTFGFTVGCMALIGVVNVIPITIGGLGTRDAVLLLVLPISGYSREAALALGFTMFLWAMGFKFSGVFFWLTHPLPTKAILSLKEKIFKNEPL